tara:strand:- start:32 stop:493 length:462 start_codon:yes stop_codon:yes gene_type:complete
MNVIIDPNKFDDKCIFFYNPVKNTVMDDSNFIRILYSNKLFTLNAIFIKLKLNIINIEKYFNKSKCCFNIKDNKDIIDKIAFIEDKILHKYSYNKNIKNKIYDQLMSGNIKLFIDNLSENSNKCEYLLKISGIWETDNDCGITYKFVDMINHL